MQSDLRAVMRAFSKKNPVAVGEYADNIAKILIISREKYQLCHKVKFEKSRLKPVEADLENLSEENLRSLVGSVILDFNLIDIRKFGKVKNPDQSYVPKHPMAVAITCDIGGWSWWINFRMGGGIMPDAWTSQSSHAMLELGLGPCKNMFEAIMDEADFEYGTIGSYKSADVDEEKFDDWLLNCTYFSKNGNYSIPPDMPDVEYEETAKGVYLTIGNKLCTSTDDPEYQEQKQVRLEATRRIKQANGLN